MALSFEDLKKNRGAKSLEILHQEAAKLKPKTFAKDERYWYPQTDKAGNGSAIIRFLPAPEGETAPWSKMIRYSIKGPTGQYYIENSLYTLGKEDPVNEIERQIWATNTKDEARKKADKLGKKVEYTSNILVVKDPANPENDGKVFLFTYKAQVWSKIMAKTEPEDELESPVNIFDLWDGMNLKLVIRKKNDYPNYESSEWLAPSAIADTDEKIKAIYLKSHPLKPLTDPEYFKTYEELKAKYNKVMGAVDTAGPQTSSPALKSQAERPLPSKEVADEFESDEGDGEDVADFLKRVKQA